MKVPYFMKNLNNFIMSINLMVRKNIILLMLISIITSSCGLYKKTDSRKIPTSGPERARQNLEEGRGVSLKNFGRGGKTTFEFSTSNPLWRASLEILEFLPLANIDYSGGVIVTDWYSDNINSNQSIKITVNFLSNEIRSDSLKIIVHEQKCSGTNNCVVKVLNSAIRNELITSIVKRAAELEKNIVKK